MENETLNKRLSRLRQQKGLTAKEMARLIDVAETTYRDWESGKNAKSLMPFERISRVLAVSVTELITGQLPDRQGLLLGIKGLEEKVLELKIKISTMI